ncbi:MAG: hypothetical protein HS116_12285 [Planctomycetes bacterium]|nr:hypothetical protein [Planctomycetota bacterium]
MAAFVKFFGQSGAREAASTSIVEELKRSGSHWACTYSPKKRPRQVRDGDTMYLAKLVTDPHGIFIYGRATALRHIDGRDEATPEEIALRAWKTRWPLYIRVERPEFINGSLGCGVALEDLMDALDADAFASTQRNKAKGQGNTDPRKAIRQQAHVKLSEQGAQWLHEKFNAALAQHGRFPAEELAKLDGPKGNPPL